MRLLYYICLAVCLIAFMWRGVGACHFNYTFDDPPYYLQDAHKLTHGYFEHNLHAWGARLQGEKAEFMRLTTEGGFPFLLFVLNKVDARAPFLINALLWPLAIFALAGFLCVAIRNTVRGRLAALLVPLLLLLNGYDYWLWQFCQPYRDPLAHLIVFGSLLLLVAGFRMEKIAKTHAVIAGIMIGVATWVRIPSIVMTLPALLAIALWSKKRIKPLLGLWLIFGIGIAIGLLPLIGQTLLEGKHVTDVGQMQLLVIKPSGDVSMSDSVLLPKLHLLHLPHTLPEAAAKLADSVSWWLGLLMVFGVVVGVLTSWRATLIISVTGLTLFLFYSCYYSVKPRYFFPVYLCLVSIAAYAPAWLVVKLFQSRRLSVLRPAVTNIVVCLTGLLVCGMCFRNSSAWPRLADQWGRARRFEAWLAKEFTVEDVMLTNRRSLKTWVDYFSPGLRTRINWIWSADNIDVGNKFGRGVVGYGWNADFIQPWDRSLITLDRARSIKVLLASGRNVYLLLREKEGEPSPPSWWRNDLELHFDILPYGTFHADSSGTVYAAYKIVTAADARSPRDALLGSLGGALRQSEAVEVAFDDYETAPTAARLLENAALRWRGYPRWQRDCGGDDQPHHRSHPMFYMGSNTTVCLPRVAVPLAVQLHTSIYADDTGDRDTRSPPNPRAIMLFSEPHFNPVFD